MHGKVCSVSFGWRVAGMISSSSTLADGNEDTTNAADSGQTATVDIAEEEEDESMKFKPPDADTEPLAQIEKISFEIESLKQSVFQYSDVLKCDKTSKVIES